jgi:hypothetical protein
MLSPLYNIEEDAIQAKSVLSPFLRLYIRLARPRAYYATRYNYPSAIFLKFCNEATHPLNIN